MSADDIAQAHRCPTIISLRTVAGTYLSSTSTSVTSFVPSVMSLKMDDHAQVIDGTVQNGHNCAH